MKTSWLNMFTACVLPLIVGVGVCGGMIQLLKNQDLFQVDAARRPVTSEKQSRKAALPQKSAEIRAALPVDGTSEMVKPRMPASAEKAALLRAAAEELGEDAPELQPLLARTHFRDDFERPAFPGGMQVEGTAFGTGPVRGALPEPGRRISCAYIIAAERRRKRASASEETSS
jgi:hypothetical protein